ncbi:MAG: HAD-IA family hydrolase [Tepidiformaceae bacterium]
MSVPSPRPPFRAAIFDIGGVLTASPNTGLKSYAAQKGLAWEPIGRLLSATEGAWSRWETSACTQDEFVSDFEQECLGSGFTVDGHAFLGAFFPALTVREEMVAAVRALKGRVALACITNNVSRDDSRPAALLQLDQLFEVVIESSKVGLRKPDPRIYEMACTALGVPPREAIFLDDFGINLKAARALGMYTIKVDETLSGLEELEAALGMSLRAP